jgi:hypothetical protein
MGWPTTSNRSVAFGVQPKDALWPRRRPPVAGKMTDAADEEGIVGGGSTS